MGNFVSEFALAEGLSTFNVATFAAGGKIAMMGNTFDADETKDDLAFGFFSEQADYDATVFDLRPLRTALHQITSDKRTNLHLSYSIGRILTMPLSVTKK